MAGTTWTFVKASWKGGTQFVVENRDGTRQSLVARPPDGKIPRHFSPVDAFIASLAACAGTNVILLLDEEGVKPRSFTIKAECVFRHEEPRCFEKIHLTFLVSGDANEEMVRDAITRSVTAVCPIAVTIGKAAGVTWECRVTKK
jgi:putative redox protein